MEKEKDSLADYFLTDNEERRKYEREKREEIKRIEREQEEYDRAKRLEEIRRRGAEKILPSHRTNIRDMLPRKMNYLKMNYLH